MTVVREDVMNVLRRLDFTSLTEDQALFLLTVSEDELRLMLEHHGLAEEALLCRAHVYHHALSLLAPFAQGEDGRWRTIREALERAPFEVATVAARLLGEAGFTVEYGDES